MLGASVVEEIAGKRPGEMIGCIHSARLQAGCGTSEFCRECGAARAVLQSQSEKTTVVSEASISTVAGGPYEFRVWASPWTYEGRDFTIVTLLDIHDEKRRQALERTFFHDVNNILTVLAGHSQLLAASGDPACSLESVAAILSASNRLVEEIASQRRLLQAESGELAVSISNVNSRSLLDEARQTFATSPDWSERAIAVDNDSDEVELATDKNLLRRVIENMTKNALEATTKGQKVLLACKKSGSSVVFSVHNPGFMPRPVQLQVFQRSFSQKGKGRGIGTYSMKLFGERYLKGKVWFSTSEDAGTTFHVSLPPAYSQNAPA
ncbi:MAG: HAMP domain-containing sensor histidine kinase [Planctomycetota bacterium]|nr:HAMP domain-containing sensor histidine kinase [Planctomycetota bacterium]